MASYREDEINTYEDFEKMFKGFKGTLWLYISGSQGVSPGWEYIEYGKDFTTLAEVSKRFDEWVNDWIMDYYEDYKEDIAEDYDDEDDLDEAAFSECLNDIGCKYVGVEEQDIQYQYEGWGYDSVKRIK